MVRPVHSCIFAPNLTLSFTVGVYLSGPLWGRIVDKRGPRILFICGFTFLLIGYSGMRYLYDTGLPKGVESLSMTSFILLILFSVLTGSGGNAGLTACVNSIAKTFPDRTVRCLPHPYHQEMLTLR